jgi:hypothetical protein
MTLCVRPWRPRILGSSPGWTVVQTSWPESSFIPALLFRLDRGVGLRRICQQAGGWSHLTRRHMTDARADDAVARAADRIAKLRAR